MGCSGFGDRGHTVGNHNFLRLPAQIIRSIIPPHTNMQDERLRLRYCFLNTAVALLLFLDCFSDAPRDNPLDPVNGISLGGKVQRLYSDRSIPGALVQLHPGNRVWRTDGSGTYEFAEIPPGQYHLMVSAEGYSSDSAMINIDQDTNINFVLDSLPYFRDISLTTIHISRWFPPDDIYSIQFEVIGGDGDGIGDIDRVWYQIESLSFTDTLQQVAPGNPLFRGQVRELQLPVTSLHELIGKPFRFHIRDLPQHTTVSSPQFITRVIDETPQLISPVGLSTISSDTINFRWQAVSSIQFPFTYRIEIYRISVGLKVHEIENIDSNVTTYVYHDANNVLIDGEDYYWILYIVDEHGNQSGSKEGSFRVQR